MPMDKTAQLSNPESNNIRPKPKRRRSPTVRAEKDKTQKRLRKKQTSEFKWNLLLISLEILGLSIIAVSAIIVLLGYSANRFSGTSFFNSVTVICLSLTFRKRFRNPYMGALKSCEITLNILFFTEFNSFSSPACCCSRTVCRLILSDCCCIWVFLSWRIEFFARI